MNNQSERKVVIDCFPESVERYREDYAIVAIDVIRATTTAITSVVMGQRCYPVPTLEDAQSLSTILHNPYLAGELGGNVPYGFDLNNSPAVMANGIDHGRPLILLSSSGTQLIHNAQSGRHGTYIACFRNYKATAKYLSMQNSNIAIIGAGTRGEFREEDQMCCAWIAEFLIQSGFVPVDQHTSEIVRRWSGATADACLISNSVKYLRKSGQEKDLEFILSHVNDVNAAFKVTSKEVTMIPVSMDNSSSGKDEFAKHTINQMRS
ncbi:MAG: 2-phosphosulfolactate phosphatase [Bacteroidota bacterium]